MKIFLSFDILKNICYTSDMSVKIQDLRKEYDLKTMGLDGVSLEAESGGFLTVVGAPGSGKTTLLFCIGGLLNATGGKIFFDGRDVTDEDIRFRNVCLMREGENPSKGSVFDNISYGLRLRRADKKTIKERTERAAEIMGIADKLNVRMSKLSELDRRRTALARGIARRPEVFLLDEPLFGMDEGREELIRDIKTAHEACGATFILSSSQGEDAFLFGGRTAVMRSGKIVQCGDREELTSSPINMFVAAFVGDDPMNFIRSGEGHIGFRSTDATVGGEYKGRVENITDGGLLIRLDENEPPITVKTDFAANKGDEIAITPLRKIIFDKEGNAITKYI